MKSDPITDMFAQALHGRAQEVLDRCTRCGACFEACPTKEPAGIADRDAKAVTAGVLEILKTGSGPADSERWAKVCSGSGCCIPKCQDGVNPRFMLALARVEMQRRATPEQREATGRAAFGKMGRGVRVLSRMQLPPEIMRRLKTPAARAAAPDFVFYTGCNVLKTPHIVLLCLDVLDALGASYEVMGGPGDCCGVLQFRSADTEASGRIGYRTTDKFAATGAHTVLSWCPTCTIQLGENVLPGREDPAYSLAPMVVYIASQLERLKPLMKHRVEKRVGLHEHPGVAGVTESAIKIIKAIPGVEYVDLEQPRIGYMCNTLQPLPEFKRDYHRGLLETAAAAKVDVLAGVYHACHRELCSHEVEWPFEVVNFLELLGESMGLKREDHYKRLKAMHDVDAVVADVMDLVEANGLGLDEVREVIAKELLAEQPLPLRGARIVTE